MSRGKKLLRIPKRGLHWTKAYAKKGDLVAIYPLMHGLLGFDSVPQKLVGKVQEVRRNHFGRISYRIGGKLVMTEELTPLHHKGCSP